ncbi:zinc ribbon domain-containing protein [Pediococcus pentosaceus]|uniref:zinc ribbon domain-containing protein n=1 Tax=Pediococcus pentosaceus TaxID=1255 RepID=UPI00223A6DC1|nr:zinc ribbon domain-containing protein [Pediococcus pentosaceus]
MKYCLNCGEELPKKANFCPNCGVTLENEAKNEPSTLTRAEMYKQRSEEAEEIEEELQTEEAETNSHSRTQAHAGSEWLSQIKNFVLWVKHNPLVSLLPIVIALVVLIWLNRIVVLVY